MLSRNKILLLHPLGYQASSAGKDVSRMTNIMPPLGLASMAAYLEQRGMNAEIIDCYAHPESDRLIVERLKSEQPAFLGLSCTTSSFLDGIRIAEIARQTVPGIQTVFGGAHVSALKEKLFPDFPAMDYAVIGEGEETLFQLMKNGGEAPGEVKGIIYRDGKEGPARFTGYPETSLVLDELPFPAYEKLAGYPKAYMLPIFNYPRVPNASCISSRGCPYSCSYCDRSVFRRSFRYNSAEYLYAHLKHLREKFGVRHINFYDDQFTFNKKRVEEFTELILQNPLGMTFNCAVRAEHIDEALVRRMKRAGCWMMSLGIESGDQDLLAQHRQNPNLDFLAEKIRMIKGAGIRTKGLLMIGLPGETEESVQHSMDYVFSLPIDDFNLAKFTPFPGSPIYERIHELGEFEEKWEKMDCMNFVFVTKGMTKERLEELFQNFYRNHFKRPKVLWGYVTMLWRSPDSWLRFLKSLSGFLRFIRMNRRLMEEEG
jgi:anaerobic magnesium-protoporphyrin IX monomethyl ester cyclase